MHRDVDVRTCSDFFKCLMASLTFPACVPLARWHIGPFFCPRLRQLLEGVDDRGIFIHIHYDGLGLWQFLGENGENPARRAPLSPNRRIEESK